MNQVPIRNQDLRVFAGGWFVLLTGLSLWLGFRHGFTLRSFWLPLSGAFLFALSGLKFPERLLVLYHIWMAVGGAIGRVMTTVLLTVFYFTFLLPFTLVRFSDPLRLRRGLTTNWVSPRAAERTLNRFRRPF